MNMMTFYTGEKPTELALQNGSIFLAGPTPRSIDVPSWRPRAIEILKEINYPGIAYCPEFRTLGSDFDYMKQVDWEHESLNRADIIVFWVPRDMATMPALTTNIEFGRFVGRKATVYGRPANAPHNSYMDWWYNKSTGRKPFDTLEETLSFAWQTIRVRENLYHWI